MEEKRPLNTLTATLDGVSYTLRGDASLPQLQQTVDAVQRKLVAIRRAAPHYSGQRVAMLAALQLAEELVQLQEEYLEMLEAADLGRK